ncbi:DUF262 domain-containing protein [Elizabethkingia anophelis]|uniref:DUF262 domain-containing protein n=1 Tax=Elizabethkingia anophelis TaxID=1117645 RepID=UPI003462AAAB|nr:DUF262 domain-containing protein [Elizabethkingia anophelis]
MDLKNKLKESIPSNTLKILELYNKIELGTLDTSPNFQRKLVWKKQHKYSFIETILLNFPFPEIYIASAEVDIVNLRAIEIVVDGQQRLNAIVDYIKGRNDFAEQNKITSFKSLNDDEKKEFLNYPVSVKDLKDIGDENIKEIFRRINSTEYSLNANEIINAQFGDGEFAIFCKQLADKDFQVKEEMTDIRILNEDRELVNKFFFDNKIFTENDVKRMFDSQYLMLLSATILDGKYFGRNTRINHYLEKYNAEFSGYEEVLKKLINSIKLINSLKLPLDSYWYNKPNLFNLIIEFKNLDINEVSVSRLERKLLDLEEKVDIYFSGDEDDIKLLLPEETKFFEVSRQGSHELSAREHRAIVINNIINEAKKSDNDELESSNITIFNSDQIDYVIIIPTATGLSKSIMDATSTVREFFKSKGIHDYESQSPGPDHKIKIEGFFVNEQEDKKTTISLYRSNGRGDYRIWFTELNSFAQAEDRLAITYQNNVIKVYNLSRQLST